MSNTPAYREVYDRRWKLAAGTSDEDILALDHPPTQAAFFYQQYNRLIASTMRSHWGETEGKSLLEIGCGRGTSAIYQALRSKMSVTLTDYSDSALEIARRNVDKYGIKAEICRADLFALPFPDNQFDAVISLGVMEHIEETDRGYSEMLRVLKPGGLIISMNVPEKPGNIQRLAARANSLLARCFSKEDKKWLDKGSRSKTADVYRTFKTSSDFARDATAAGSPSVRIIEVNPFPTWSPLPPALEKAVVLLYQGILRIRSLVASSEDPFYCSERNSRAHFLIAEKGL